MKNLMIASVAILAFTFTSANSVEAGGGHHGGGHHGGGHHGGGHHGGGHHGGGHHGGGHHGGGHHGGGHHGGGHHGGFFLPWHFGHNTPQSIMPRMDNWDTDCIPRSNKVKFGLKKFPLSTIS